MMTPNTDRARILAAIARADMIEGACAGNLTKLRHSNYVILQRTANVRSTATVESTQSSKFATGATVVISLKAFNKQEKSSE
jgi:hypothetical protein